VLDQQVKDWNAGDVVKFMRGYDRSEKTRFASGGNITLGWQSVLERYQRTYSDKAAMGTLTFSDIDITVVSEDSALAFGRWHLKREKDDLPASSRSCSERRPMVGRLFTTILPAAERKAGD